MILAALEPLIPWIVGALVDRHPAHPQRLDLDMRVRYWRDIANRGRTPLPPYTPAPAVTPESPEADTSARMEDAA